jgi:hypothetical protein
MKPPSLVELVREGTRNWSSVEAHVLSEIDGEFPGPPPVGRQIYELGPLGRVTLALRLFLNMTHGFRLEVLEPLANTSYVRTARGSLMHMSVDGGYTLHATGQDRLDAYSQLLKPERWMELLSWSGESWMILGGRTCLSATGRRISHSIAGLPWPVDTMTVCCDSETGIILLLVGLVGDRDIVRHEVHIDELDPELDPAMFSLARLWPPEARPA